MTMAPTRFETLTATLAAHRLTVVLDRPERDNSINDTMLGELHAALDLAEQDERCRLVVLSGANGVFCTGMDLGDASRGPSSPADVRAGGERFLGLLTRLTTLRRVVVSQVDGRVAGGGVGLVAASDFVHATPRSSFSLPEALWGLLPACVLPFLIRRTGAQPAHALMLSTLPLTAERAAQVHLVDEVGEDATPYLNRLRSRLSKMDATTIGDAKAYTAALCGLSEQTRALVLDEFTRLMCEPAVRSRLAGFARDGSFPWEAR